MKHLTVAALMLTLGVTSVYAQETPVKMKFSGTATPSTVNLQTGTGVSEYNLAGKGTRGASTIRLVSASAAAPQPSNSCDLYFPVLAGSAVIRFQDGSLLKLKLTGGADCIHLAIQQADCPRIFEIVGGTGRFEGASGGELTLDMVVGPVVPGEFGFSVVTAEMTGTIDGVDMDNAQQDTQ